MFVCIYKKKKSKIINTFCDVKTSIKHSKNEQWVFYSFTSIILKGPLGICV